jgi:hypothetical protein
VQLIALVDGLGVKTLDAWIRHVDHYSFTLFDTRDLAVLSIPFLTRMPSPLPPPTIPTRSAFSSRTNPTHCYYLLPNGH